MRHILGKTFSSSLLLWSAQQRPTRFMAQMAAEQKPPVGGYTSRTMDPNAGARDADDSDKMLSPSCERNKAAILGELKALLPTTTTTTSSTTSSTPFRVLEVACGTGQHTGCFAAALPHLRFSPSDLTADAFGSVRAWSRGLANVDEPFTLDCASAASWAAAVEDESVDAIYLANMCHISPYAATDGLFRAAARVLRRSGAGAGGGEEEGVRAKLIIYGPFTTGGAHTTESNAAFDQSLRARDPSWGYRDIEADLGVLAQASGLELVKRVEMPANNFLLVYSRSTA